MPTLYDQFLTLLSTSEFSKLLPKEELEVLKDLYKENDPVKIQEAIDQIKAFDQALEQSRIQQEKAANDAAEALNVALQELQKKRMLDLKKQEIFSQKQEKNILKSLEEDLLINTK